MRIILVALLSSVLYAPLFAQDTVAVMRATLLHIARSTVAQPITLDPRPGGTGVGVFAVHILAAVAVDSTVVVTTAQRAQTCERLIAPGCRTKGQAAFARLKYPVFQGERATLDLSVNTARDLNGADSAEIRRMHISRDSLMKTSNYRGPAFNIYDSSKTFERMSRRHTTLLQVTLRRVAGIWSVESVRVTGGGSE